jgi:TldD protein
VEEILKEAISLLQKKPGVDYAEARFQEESCEQIQAQNTKIEKITKIKDKGIGIRVLYKGSWGFAATPVISLEEIQNTANQAFEVARASSLVNIEKVALSQEEQQKGKYKTPRKIDPFSLPLETKIQDLIEAMEILRGNEPEIKNTEGIMKFFNLRKIFMNTEGSFTDQEFLYVNASLEAIAISDKGEVQRRSFRKNEGTQGGYEIIQGLKLKENALRVREQVLALLKAPPCPSYERSLILDPSQLTLQIHESCGHPSELDRALGTEISLAGGSFLTLDRLGNFKYGSNIVNITADPTTPGGLGTFMFDDEGILAKKTPIIQDGIFVGYLSSRETAFKIKKKSSGAMRASAWNRIPLIRMVNINLEPQKGSLDELINDTKDGVYLQTNKSWSIDDLRLNFQFGCEIAWEIKDGKKTRILKNPVYTGITPVFWGQCDAICGPEEWKLYGVMHCGKGEPIQTMRVGHGSSPARFQKIKIGSGK